jgi:phosphoribosylanthranilate isomerase
VNGPKLHVKICGVTCVEDARAAIAAGASAVGLNFVPPSPRCIDVATARAVAEAIGDRALVVGVVADMDVASMRRLRDEAMLGCLQLHGDEPPEALEAMLPHAYKAIRVATEEHVALADRYGGEHLLVDARVEGRLGGTGRRVDVALVAPLARRRKLTLAGGLDPSNVAAAIAAIPGLHCVDVAGGVERAGDPRRKDDAKMRAFVAAAHAAARLSAPSNGSILTEDRATSTVESGPSRSRRA